MVLTSDSDFLIFEVQGVIILDGIKSLNNPWVYYPTMILNHFHISKEQLYYFIAIRGNDFVNPSTAILMKDEKKMSVADTMEYVKKHFTPEVKNSEKYKIIEQYYSLKQVTFPWNLVTTDIFKVKMVKKNINNRSFVKVVEF